DPVCAQHVFPINLREEPPGIGMPYRLEDLDFGNVGFCYFHNSWCPRWFAFMVHSIIISDGLALGFRRGRQAARGTWLTVRDRCTPATPSRRLQKGCPVRDAARARASSTF